MNKLFNWHSNSIILLFFLASCSVQDSKLFECQQFITIKQETDNRTLELSENLQTKDKQKVLAVADNFESAAIRLENMAIEEPKLLKLKTSWFQFYLARAKATRDYLTAFDRLDIQATKQTIEKIQQLDHTEIKLVNEINSYCQEKPDN